MKTNSLFWALSWVAVGSFAAMQGCGGDDDDDGDGSTGGNGGSSGSATGGKGGSSGSATGGKGGSSGSATGGSSGAAGAPGGAGGDDGVGGEGGGSGESRAAVCADYCAVYYDTECETYDANFYGSEAGCAALCEQAVWELGTPGAAAGNSVHCRLTHAGLAAAATDPTTHCGHAAATPTAVCVP